MINFRDVFAHPILKNSHLYFSGLLLLFVVSLCTSFSTSWEMYTVFRFFTGFFSGGGNTVLYVLMQEKLGNKWWAVACK